MGAQAERMLATSMQMLPINLTEVLGVVLGISTVLIPIAGFTLRFALKPFADALGHARSQGASRDELTILEKRIALLERELELRSLPAPQVAPAVSGGLAPLRELERT